MSSQTPNLNLVLPVGTEKVSRQIINDNNTKIDTAVGANSEAITNLSDSASKQRGNIPNTAVQSDTSIIDLLPGTYQNVQGSSAVPYLPTPYGTLVVNDSGEAYKNYIYISTDTPKVYVRQCHKTNRTWYSGWQELVTQTNQLRTLTSLFEFTGTSEQQISVSGGRNIDSYALIHFDLYDTNGNIIASLCASPRMLRGNTKHYIYASSTSIWASFGFTNNSQNITVNRTSSTTSKFRCYGID